jgi:organic hydroperoxide reductase OsmC/OhrA
VNPALLRSKLRTMPEPHHYDVQVTWTGNLGTGTSAYRAYSREHVVTADGRAPLPGSSDPAFRGDPTRWNPEQLLVASLAQCHMLWYLHLASSAGVVVTAYEDVAHGVVAISPDGAGQFESVTLHPTVTVTESSMRDLAEKLHHDVPGLCFVARSVNFPVRHEPTIKVADDAR